MASNGPSIFGKQTTAAPNSDNPPTQQPPVTPQAATPGQAPGNADSLNLAETAPTGANPPRGKSEGQDENNPISQGEEIESLQQGAAEQSAPAQRASGNPPAGQSSAPEETGEQKMVEYTSHPINRFRLGRFQFERGVLRLPEGSDDLARFQKLLAGASARDRALIRGEGDIAAAANAVASRYLADSRMRSGIDTSEPKPGEPR